MDPALEQTLAFITDEIPSPRRLLEVGCGDGRLAAALSARGHDITALDVHLPSDLPPGPRFIEQDFLADHDDHPYDAILFTHSLHHISPLEAALDRARALLAPGGLIVIEDFDVAAPDEATAAFWWAIAEHHDHAHGDSGGTALDRWRTHHDHTPPLHTATTMYDALAARFATLAATVGPYLYRYAASDAEMTSTLVAEQAAIGHGTVLPVGRRWIVRLPHA